MSFVNVSGDGAAQAFPEGASQADGEAIVQTWQKAAVLRVTPDIPVYWGFMAGEAQAQFLNQPAQTQGGQFAVRVGRDDVKFFVIAVDLRSRPTLELVEVVDLNEPKYQDLPLY